MTDHLSGWKLSLLVVAMAAAGLWAYYQWTHPTYDFRYRLTIEVETPDGIKSGSSVIGGRAMVVIDINGTGFLQRTAGDAIFVDLGGGRNVVALLAVGSVQRYMDFYHFAPEALGFKVDFRNREATYKALEVRRDSVEVSSPPLPLFATFPNVENGRTARVFEASQFATVLGPEFRFKRAIVALTKEPLTRGIESKLPWMKHPERYYRLPNNHFSYDAPVPLDALSRSY